MKNNLGKFLAVGSLVAGGFIFAMPANAIVFSLGIGDTFDIGTYGAKFTGVPVGPFNASGDVATKIEFDDNPGIGRTWIAPFGTAKADLQGTSNATLLAAVSATTNIGIVKVKSLDLTDVTKFTPSAVPDFNLAGGANNTFIVDSSLGDFIAIDVLPADTETPDVAIRLKKITTTQVGSLNTSNASISVGVTGDVEFITLGLSGFETLLGTGSFSGTFPTGAGGVASGTGVLSFVVTSAADVPESSPVSALIGFGLVGSAFALRRKAKLS